MQGQFDEQAVAGTCPHLLSLDGTPAANHAHLFYAPIITLSRLSHAAIRDGTPPPPPPPPPPPRPQPPVTHQPAHGVLVEHDVLPSTQPVGVGKCS
jgi:hypothetical protein